MRAGRLVWALIAGTTPAAIAYALGPDAPLPWWPLVLVVPLAWPVHQRSGPTGAWWLAVVLAAAAVLAAGRARTHADGALGHEDWPHYDLTQAPMPTNVPEYAAVRGVLRDGWVLGEYAVAEGDIPDQSQPAAAVLIPLTASADPTVPLRGAIVVARVRAATPRTTEPVTLFGRIEPLPEAITLTLVDLTPEARDAATGVLLDTLRVPQAGEAWTAVALLVGLALGAAVAFALGARQSTDTVQP